MLDLYNYLSGKVFFKNINDFYIRMCILGEGAYATVQKVWNFRLDKEFACKRLPLKRLGKADQYVE